MSIPVATVGRAAGDLVAGLEGLRGPIAVVRHCAELAELIAVCQSGLARAAIVSTGIDELTASVLDRFRHQGVSLLVLSDDGAQQRRLQNLGVATAPERSGAADLAAQICRIVDAGQDLGVATRSGGADPGYADASAPLRTHAATDPPSEGFLPQGSRGPAGPGPAGVAEHRVLAVWGPVGSPGKTTVAVNLAAEAAATGDSVLLIDADTYGPSVAATLGLLDESAGIAQACRYAEQGVLDPASLLKSSVELVVGGSTLRVLTGLSRADRWPELRSSALRQVLDRSREVFQTTVIDCGFALEADEELSFDTMAPRRNGSALLVLSEADQVIAVGAADSIGVPRLLRALDEVLSIVPAACLTVVLNKVRASAVGRRPEAALRRAWERFGPSLPIAHFLPWEPESADRALLAGQALREAAADSQLRRKIADIIGADAQRSRRSAVSSNTAGRTVSR
ncbi:MAG: P-loop NTPase [Renibacterium sp.]|nr:P-loop NTPase [Renibacterium sp.]